MTGQPFISVLLPVYNAEKYVVESIESILAQTYSNFELIIINDGSTDHSLEVIRKMNDPRIQIISHENIGMAASLNKGIAIAKGEFIARQDADDISHKQRFEKQLDHFRANPNTALLGTRARIFPVNGEERFHKHPAENEILKFDLMFDNPFVHSSVMMRAAALKTTGLYDVKKHSLLQDYDLWSRFARFYEIANLPEVLLDYREVGSGISQSTQNFSKTVALQSAENLKEAFPGYDIAMHDIASLYHGQYADYSRATSISEMEYILLKLADMIASDMNADTISVRLRARQHIKMLRCRYNVSNQLYYKRNALKRLYFKVVNKIESRNANLNWH